MGVFQNNLLAGAAAAATAGGGAFYSHQIGQSARFDSASTSYLSQDADYSTFATADLHYIGSNPAASELGFDGYLAEFIFTDGQSYAPTQFAEEKNGVWIPKDPSGTTFGNNGFHLKFENASDLGNDSSGNNNDFTANNMGADHQVLDSPTFGS